MDTFHFSNEEISNNGWCEKEGTDHFGKPVYKRFYHMRSNPLKQDSDGDNWSDPYEINVSKTDPMKADTDDDGIIDNEDKYPLSMQPSFMSTLKKMEKIVDEFKSSIKIASSHSFLSLSNSSIKNNIFSIIE